jgi:hypothetical protein
VDAESTFFRYSTLLTYTALLVTSVRSSAGHISPLRFVGRPLPKRGVRVEQTSLEPRIVESVVCEIKAQTNLFGTALNDLNGELRVARTHRS